MDVLDNWLKNNDTDYLRSLLILYQENELEMYPVSRAVNSPKNDRSELVDRLPE